MLVAERLAREMCGEDQPEQAKAMIAQMLTWPLPGEASTTDESRGATGSPS
ncbi:hypothetical protein Ade02nite_44560 [Paractinoplanes deccanensis]|uniref:Uncharacterized protein n=1 Tax=Paractinoplanes deccanensis TaxID=113561 RepID=A0ABQ3Y767_9ACTN|nr:hypothetical protein [Actinoplanes deccanensis]GID75815.1 hypothetical protein Ade02nite_44560 [Actinoplanes deccanensis]